MTDSEQQQGQEQQAIPIQMVWQMLGEKEWQIQMLKQQLAQVRQRLAEALAAGGEKGSGNDADGRQLGDGAGTEDSEPGD